jgi:glycosyltransferase involved in cell wall biosynthesis
MKKISIIFSFYNEEKTIDFSTQKIVNVLNENKEIDYEIIFINDNSNDNSLDKIYKLRENNNKIKIINLSRRFGHMHGIMAGLKNCTGDAAIYLDIDLQDPPEVINQMLNYYLNEDYDVVFTTRIKRHGENFLKKIMSKIGYLILKKLTYINMEVDSGDFKLISRKVIEHVITFEEINPFFRFIVDYVGFKRKQIFYERQARFHGQSKFPIGKKVINQFFEISLFPFSDAPLRFIFWISWLFLIIFIFYVFYNFFNLIFNQGFKLNIQDYLLTLVTLNFFALGIFSSYLSSIFKEVKRRPNYIIKDKIGFDKE